MQAATVHDSASEVKAAEVDGCFCIEYGTPIYVLPGEKEESCPRPDFSNLTSG